MKTRGQGMKVKDLWILDGTWDVYETIADQIAIAYCSDGEYALTAEGEEYFKEALEVPIKKINADYIIIDTEQVLDKATIDAYSFEDGDCPPIVEKLIEYFQAHAGYCSDENAKKWFL